MERRRFLKGVGLAVFALAAPLPFPSAAAAAKGVSYGGQLYRAGRKGRILCSSDGGTSWGLHSDLGDMYTLTGLAVDRFNKLRATVRFGERTFSLVLAPDLVRWLTT